MDIGTLKQIILDQREEIEETNKREYIITRNVLDRYKKYLPSKQIKIITGPRRAGKSTVCYQLLKNKNFAYINFDDENLISLQKEDFNRVLKAFYELYKNVQFIFLDEIQNIEGWELFVNRLKRKNFNMVITGSNSKLLSKELASHLTGRHFSLELFPFSFREFLYFHNVSFKKEDVTSQEESLLKTELQKYMTRGGISESYREPEPQKYLQSLYSSIIGKDIIMRYHIKYIKAIRELSLYLLSNFSCRITFNKLKNIFSLRSVHTAQNYISYLEESYVVFLIEKFSYKLKERVSAPRKVYVYDTGLACAVASRITEDFGRLYENIVAIELMRRKSVRSDLEIYYWQDYSGREIDFVVKKGLNITELIQVCYDIDTYDTRIRELRSFIKAGKELTCDRFIVLTQEKTGKEKFEDKTIEYIPLWKWLLEDVLEV